MKIVSENIKNALKQSTTQRKGRILVDDVYYDVHNVEYYADAYNDGNVIGNATASQLDFDLPYMDKFETFEYYDGVWTGNEYEYVYMGEFIVFDEQDEDEFNKHITAFDKLINFNAPFKEIGSYPRTLFEELQNICQQANVPLININIPNGDFVIENNQFVSGENLKTVLKAICQISGNYAIVKNDSLVLQLKNKTDEKLDRKDHEPIIWKRKTYGINQVVLGMADVEGEYVLREDLEDIAKNGVHKLIINDNPFAYTQDKRKELIDELFEQVRGFGYIPFEMNSEWFNYFEIGDTITLDEKETIILRINGKSPNSLESTMSAPAIIDSSVEYVNNTSSIENKIARAEVIVNKNTQEIQALANKVVDVSNVIKGVGSIKLENAHEGILHKISIKGNISLVFPNNNLFPSNDLYSKSSNLLIDEEKYKLDLDYLNYINDTICDEFIYEEGKCKIIRRVGIDDSGNLYQLDEEVVENRADIILNVKKDSTIKLESFDSVTYETEYLLENKYTEVFATQVDVQSQIKVATDEINLEVGKKVNETDVISTINLSPEQISLKSNRLSIESDNFNLTPDGRVQSVAGTIGGWKIEENMLYAENYSRQDYTEEDLNLLQQYLQKQVELDEEQKEYLDANGDKVLDIRDLLLIRKNILYGITSRNPSKILMFSGETGNDSSYQLVDGNGVQRLGLDLSGIRLNDGDKIVTISTNGIDGLGIGKYIHLTKSSNQTIGASTRTKVIWDVEEYNDTNGILELEDSKIVLKSGSHNIQVVAQLQKVTSSSKYIYIQKVSNGVAEDIHSLSTTGQSLLAVAIVHLEEGESIQVQCYDNTSGAITSVKEWTNLKAVILN